LAKFLEDKSALEDTDSTVISLSLVEPNFLLKKTIKNKRK